MNIIDLFSGAGGLTEGFSKEGYEIIAHVEKDKNACKTLETRLAYKFLKKMNKEHYYKSYVQGNLSRNLFLDKAKNLGFNSDSVICDEINLDTLDSIFGKIDELKGAKSISGIIGGPPCQAYSTIGRPMNSLKKDKDDRIYLYKLYIQFLIRYTPDFFLFENVKGLLSFKDQFNDILLEKIISDFESVGYSVSMKIINAAEYGVPQSRERLFIFGCKSNVKFFEKLETKKEEPVTLETLFSDLPKIFPNEEADTYLDNKVSDNSIGNRLRLRESGWDLLTYHKARPQNSNDLAIYKIVSNNRKKGKLIKYNELPEDLKTHKNNHSFLDRYKALDGKSISHTVVAHISKDGHYYIHYDESQNRSITVREAARIQTFPDDFYFETSRTAAFVQIGNAVPPYLSQKIANTIKELVR
ncbi:DNA cytosine methyltransferase [Exiguobacterium sp. s163]|uniref:DNA cytosine methyltransferase n=1 Tax=Exiguobacterium sp. s163 TaxID=2751287 RepID=UPI001BE5C2BE|nr:DNA cytosine methyltransferase [Exiguobacterium sp. s163]